MKPSPSPSPSLTLVPLLRANCSFVLCLSLKSSQCRKKHIRMRASVEGGTINVLRSVQALGIVRITPRVDRSIHPSSLLLLCLCCLTTCYAKGTSLLNTRWGVQKGPCGNGCRHLISFALSSLNSCPTLTRYKAKSNLGSISTVVGARRRALTSD